MRAAEAAKNTSVLIEDTVRRISDGTQMVSQTNEAFTEVSQSSVTIKDLVEEIAAASNEQAQGIEQINKAVTEMDKVVQQNAASAEQSASASQEMNAQAENLNTVVDDLVDVIGGQSNAHRRVSAPGPAGGNTAKVKESHALAIPKRKKTVSPNECYSH